MEEPKKETSETTEKGVESVESIEVKFFDGKQYMCEIGQPTGLQFAFLSAKNEQCHQWIKCRDFLHDAYRTQISGGTNGIYGFSFDPTVSPLLDLNKMRMLVKRHHNSSEKGAIENTKKVVTLALNILNCIEEANGIKPLSVLYQVVSEQETYVFEGSGEWMESTFMISLYTFLIRLGHKNIVFKNKTDLDKALEELSKKQISDHDITYLKTILPYIDKILAERKNLAYIQDSNHFMRNVPIGVFHNYSGVVALCQDRTGQNINNLEELEVLSKRIQGKNSEGEV